jgi:DNA-binding CsgD family transcriptional regulator/tetratricopeptide (TPR) repeat protein
MALVERAEQLDELNRVLGAAAHGHGHAVLLSGEAGIGKTALVRAFADQATPHARVFEGRCDEMVTPRVLGPFRDIARQHRGLFGGADLGDPDSVIETLIAELDFRQRPAALIIEDLHWADHASLDVIGAIGRRIADRPAVLIATYRDDEAHDNRRLRRLLGSLAGPATVRLHLSGLSDSAVGALAEAAGLDPDAVVRAVGGNPFFLSEVILAGGGVPESVRDAVLARVADLPDGARLGLGRISVVPTEVEPALLRRILDDPAELEPAERRGIVRATGSGVRFRHEIARRVVEAELAQGERLAAHARVLAALRDTAAEASRLVHHAVGAADEPAIGQFAAAAAEDAAQADGHAEALAFAELALRHGGDHEDRDRGRLHEVAAGALYALNRFGEAVVHADEAVRARESHGGDPAAIAEALLFSSRLSTLLADPVADRDKALRAVALLEPAGPSRVLALAYSALATQNTLRGRFAEAAGWSTQAIEMAAATGSDDVLSRTLGYRGVAACLAGDDSGLADLHEAVEIAQRIGHADYLTVAAQNSAVMLIRAGRVLDAEPFLDLAERVATEHRLTTALYRIVAQQCFVLIWRGRWDRAEARLRGLIDDAGDAGANAVNPLAFLGRLLARRGDPAAAALIETATRLAEASGEAQKLAVASAAQVEWQWLTGDVDGVRETAASLLRRGVAAGHRLLDAEVLRYLARLGDSVTPFDGCFEAYAAGIRGDFATAATLWQAAGNPYEQAWELCAAGEVAAGLDLFDRLGAQAAAAIVRRELRAAGVRSVPRGPRRSTRGNLAGLTDRQLEIVALLRQGATNAEIAQRLYLSPRTVDNHVSALLRRLGIGSRRDVEAALRDSIEAMPRES